MKLDYIDLRKQIDFIQGRYSFFWGALRSIQLNSKCVCLDRYELPSNSCTKCMGTGHSYVDKLVRVQRARSQPGVDLRTEIGKVNTTTKTFVFEQDVRPKVGDYTLELNLDSNGAPVQPFRIRRAYRIQNAWPARGKAGRIDYWYCLAEERNFDLGKPITSRPAQPVVATPISTTTVAVDYELHIGNILSTTTGLALAANYSFPIGTINNIITELPLIPQENPPAGQLILYQVDGTADTVELFPV